MLPATQAAWNGVCPLSSGSSLTSGVVQAERSMRCLPLFACNLQRRTTEAALFVSPETKREKMLNNTNVTALTSSMMHILKIRKTVRSVFIPRWSYSELKDM